MSMNCFSTWTITFVVALLYTTGHAAPDSNGISISVYPHRLFGNGSGFRITCLHPSHLNFVFWHHPAEGIISVPTGRFKIVQYNDEVSLVIKDARRIDEGTYRCDFRNGAADVVGPTFTTSYRERVRLLSARHSVHTVAAGDDLDLACFAEHFSDRMWVKVLSLDQWALGVGNTSDGRITVTSDQRILFRGIRVEDQAEYWCELQNELPGLTRLIATVNVVVLEPLFCRDDKFSCTNGQCVPLNYHCDRKDDCDDASDEEDCTPTPLGPTPEAPEFGSDRSALIALYLPTMVVVSVVMLFDIILLLWLFKRCSARVLTVLSTS